MRLRLKRHGGSPSVVTPGSGQPTGAQEQRLNHRAFLKLAGAALGVGLAGQFVVPPTPALAQTLGDPNATVTGNLTIPSGSVDIGISTPQSTLDVRGTVCVGNGGTIRIADAYGTPYQVNQLG